MTTTPPIDPDVATSEERAAQRPTVGRQRTSSSIVLAAVGTLIGVGIVGVLAFQYLKDDDANKLLQVVVAVVVGSIGVWAIYWAVDQLISAAPDRAANALRPVLFVGPAMALLALYLVYPAINTLILSFQDRRSDEWVGLDNYQTVFTEREYLIGIRNSFVWVLIVPAAAVAIGLVFATLADKLGRKLENLSKSLIFLPMAISLVGASIVFTFVYHFRAPGFGEQIGLANAIWDNFGDPVAWLAQKPWNNLYLMVILIWLQTGFSMVILSSAIKSVPDELLEAARIDGATEWQAFWRVVFPTIASTVVVVWTTVLITVWKVFDIVYVLTGGADETQVIAQQMVREFFTNRNNGVGATLAVLLFVAVIPVLVLNIKRFKAQEETR
jgi:alpha-glucoside transport system permease protein